MRLKYAKLLLNLSNAVERAVRAGRAPHRTVRAGHRRRAGRPWTRPGSPTSPPEVSDIEARWRRWGVADIDGRRRAGSSTWQSLARGTGALETDYLNGEIVLLGRLHWRPHADQRPAVRAGRDGGPGRPRPWDPLGRRRPGGPGMNAAPDPLIAPRRRRSPPPPPPSSRNWWPSPRRRAISPVPSGRCAVCVRLLPGGRRRPPRRVLIAGSCARPHRHRQRDRNARR